MRRRLFTDEEISLAAERGNDAATLAARFAVREATMKALGVGLGAFGSLQSFLREKPVFGGPAVPVRDGVCQPLVLGAEGEFTS